MKIIKIFKETISDGPGFRYSIYFSGCSHYCEGCHNPETWKGDIGEVLDESYMGKIISQISGNPLLDGVTLSGGDPFFVPEELLDFVRRLKEETHKNIWAYTGYTFEELIKKDITKKCLEYIDVLVDGRFEKNLANPELFYRGSSNQRMVDVRASITEGRVCTKDYD
ncbi:anaerobic ribonucleoside-triphosphate reductase activating protein [uncultured Ilyobacter sp.]|uniref:anaerobic ribonucleoside-triphosphate reductase activating protein n=1 Tax=uncultured Ilyobacter sp. TaxID=544433 RepID=UPI0029F4AABE|nr:anaerobic ribonucleoside-triphosphate reductase activating protein [uncultured Ilyobacter sp.]